MICVECGRNVKLVCRDCQAARARRGLLLHQRRFLQTWLAGSLDLWVRPYEGIVHLELFDARWHAYCGAQMFKITERRRSRELPPDLCPLCLKVFQELVERFGAAPVPKEG